MTTTDYHKDADGFERYGRWRWDFSHEIGFYISRNDGVPGDSSWIVVARHVQGEELAASTVKALHAADFDANPRRAVRFVLDLQADSDDHIGYALEQLATDWVLGYMREGGASGGVASGYSLTVERREVTHDQYVETLNKYLKTLREKRERPNEKCERCQAVDVDGPGKNCPACLAEMCKP